MATLSFVIVGFNEKYHLELLLPTIMDQGDEVIYLDLYSKDGSLDYARELGCRVFERANDLNVNTNRNYAFEQVKSEWIFLIDPDERVSPVLMKEVRELIDSNPEENAFRMPRKNYYFGVWQKYGRQYPDYQWRVFRKEKAKYALIHIHEKLSFEGKDGTLKNDMIHYTFLDVKQMIQRFDDYTDFEALYLDRNNVQINRRNSFKYLFWKPFTKFFKRYFLRGGFRDGLPGFVTAAFGAMHWVVRYSKLWEMKNGIEPMQGAEWKMRTNQPLRSEL